MSSAGLRFAYAEAAVVDHPVRASNCARIILRRLHGVGCVAPRAEDGVKARRVLCSSLLVSKCGVGRPLRRIVPAVLASEGLLRGSCPFKGAQSRRLLRVYAAFAKNAAGRRRPVQDGGTPRAVGVVSADDFVDWHANQSDMWSVAAIGRQ